MPDPVPLPIPSHLVAAVEAVLRPMEDAKKGAPRVLAKLKDDLSPYDTSGPDSPFSLSRWAGLWVVVQHEGSSPRMGLDLGFRVAAPVGFGGLGAAWFDGWLPLPDAAQIAPSPYAAAPGEGAR